MTDIVERHRCEDSECPYFGKPSPDKCGCHKTREQMADALIVKLKADNTYLAKTLLDMGENVVLFVDEFEDEGDRVYFGSTNHADYLRELRQKIDEVWYDQERVDEASSGRDLYAEMATLRVDLATSREQAEKLAEALEATSPLLECELRIILESCCLLDKDLQPIRETLEDASKEVEAMEVAIAKANAALAEYREAKP